MWLRPCNIYYSQKSISNTFIFDDGCEMLIGDVVDSICKGRLRKRDIPRIGVSMVQGRWYTHDNRRLWVFKTLESLGRCHKIPVDVLDDIPYQKMTTKNGGTSVVVRGNARSYGVGRNDYKYEDDEEELCARVGYISVCY